MKTRAQSETFFNGRFIQFLFVGLTSALLSLSTLPASADIPDHEGARFGGMFKVTDSSDPLFPISSRSEWFLDFGKGVSNGVNSGTVAVSLRRNPDVKVRIMVWQYFPETSQMVIGNQFDRGASGAVAKGMWTIGSSSQGVVFRRNGAQMVLNRADSRDY